MLFLRKHTLKYLKQKGMIPLTYSQIVVVVFFKIKAYMRIERNRRRKKGKERGRKRERRGK